MLENKPPTEGGELSENEEPEPSRASQPKRRGSKTWLRRKSKRRVLQAHSKKSSTESDKADLPPPEVTGLKRKLEDTFPQAKPGPEQGQAPSAQMGKADDKAAAQDRAKAVPQVTHFPGEFMHGFGMDFS